MKKPSFFERLAGNLRFDDTDEDIVVKESKKEVIRSTNKENVNKVDHEDEYTLAHSAKKEEVGELPVDVYETPSEIIIQTLIAGVLPEHLTIEIGRAHV